MKSRTFNIMQYENHPETGEPLLNEETIKKALEHKSPKGRFFLGERSEGEAL